MLVAAGSHALPAVLAAGAVGPVLGQHQARGSAVGVAGFAAGCWAVATDEQHGARWQWAIADEAAQLEAASPHADARRLQAAVAVRGVAEGIWRLATAQSAGGRPQTGGELQQGSGQQGQAAASPSPLSRAGDVAAAVAWVRWPWHPTAVLQVFARQGVALAHGLVRLAAAWPANRAAAMPWKPAPQGMPAWATSAANSWWSPAPALPWTRASPCASCFPHPEPQFSPCSGLPLRGWVIPSVHSMRMLDRGAYRHELCMQAGSQLL